MMTKEELAEGKTCLDQDLLYEIYPVYDMDQPNHPFNWDNHEKNCLILAEFLLATPYYTDMITKWFEEEQWAG